MIDFPGDRAVRRENTLLNCSHCGRKLMVVVVYGATRGTTMQQGEVTPEQTAYIRCSECKRTEAKST